MKGTLTCSSLGSSTGLYNNLNSLLQIGLVVLYFNLNHSAIGKKSVCETRMPQAATKSKFIKISKSYIFSSRLAPKLAMCEQPLDELTVQVWSLFWLPKLKILYFIMLVGRNCGQQIDRRTIWWLLGASGGHFRPGHKTNAHGLRQRDSNPPPCYHESYSMFQQ